MSETQNKQIALYGESGDPIAAAQKLGEVFHCSGLFGVSNRAQGDLLALECITQGLPPTRLLEKYHIIEGRLSLRADYLLAEFQNRGGEVIWKQWDGEAARAIFIKGKNEIEVSYTWEEACESGIPYGKGSDIKANWKRNRPDMLRARLVSKVVRMLDPGINSGMYTPEEVQDFDDLPPSSSAEEKTPLFNKGKEKAPAKKAPAKKDAKVIEAEVVEEEEKKETPKKEDPKPEEVQEEVNEETGELFEGTFKTTLEFLSSFEEAANAFSLSKKWINEKQTFRDISDTNLALIERHKEGFQQRAENHLKTIKESK